MVNFDLSTFISIVGAIAAIAVSWGVNKKTNESQDQLLASYRNQLEKLWDWKDNHEKEAGQERLGLHQKISTLEGMMEAKSKENIEIIRQLEHINTTLVTVREDLAGLRARQD